MDTTRAAFRRNVADELPGETSRRSLLRKGLLVGVGAAVVGIAMPVLAGSGTARAYVSGAGIQNGWDWCDRCQGLFYGPGQSSSACPAGPGGHDGSESAGYVLYYGTSGSDDGLGFPVQADWAWCDKCQGLFYGPFQGSSLCPAGGRHDGSESYSYDVPYGQPSSVTGGLNWQSGWAWCDKCQGLFYGPFQGSSWCPAGGRHDGSESYPAPGYDMLY
jgi:hypothetical protein